MKTTTYNGNDIFAPFNAGLYGIEETEEQELLFEESKDNILQAFEAYYKKEIVEALGKAGLKYEGLKYYSPKYYNFSTDSIDLTVSLENEGKYKEFCLENRTKIEKALSENKGYDGYIPLTADSFEEAMNNKDITIITLALAGINFSDFELMEHIVYDYKE